MMAARSFRTLTALYLAALCLVSASGEAPIRRRLQVSGKNVTTLADPSFPILLRGFTFDYIAGKKGQDVVTAQDRNVTNILPGTNLA